jgi:hypothetical protein
MMGNYVDLEDPEVERLSMLRRCHIPAESTKADPSSLKKTAPFRMTGAEWGVAAFERFAA